MKGFSVARAYSAGVDLIERKPWTIVWWAGAIIVLQLLPRFFLPGVWGGANEFAATRDVLAAFTRPEQFPTALERMKAAQQANHAFGFAGVWALWSLLVNAVLYNAAYRSVLQPGSGAFGYLRFGLAEIWQAIALLVQAIVLGACFVAGGLLMVLVGLMSRAAGDAAPLVMILGVLVIMGLLVWIVLRLSLGTVATFAERRFAFFRSWSLTRGRSWRLFWTGILTVAMVIGLMMMLLYSLVFAFIPIGAMMPHPAAAGLTPMTQGPPVISDAAMGAATAALALWMLIASLITSCLQALTLTPWAAAYKALTQGDDHG